MEECFVRTRRMGMLLSLVLGCILVLGSVGFAQGIEWNFESEEFSTRGPLEWGRDTAFQGYIVATGMAVAPSNASNMAQAQILARQGAKMDAQRSLVETLNGVVVDADSTMINFMANEIIRTRVSGFLRNAEIIIGTETWKDGIYALKMRVFLDAIYPIIYREFQDNFYYGGHPFTESKYTGLIIDATDIDFTPQLMFEIIDANGRVIFNSARADYEPAVQKGLAEYSISLHAATLNERVGDNPLVVRAIGARGAFRSQLVVSVDAGQYMLHALAGTAVFRESRIVVVGN